MRYLIFAKYYFYAWCYTVRQVPIMMFKFCIIYGKWYKYFWKEWDRLIREELLGK